MGLVHATGGARRKDASSEKKRKDIIGRCFERASNLVVSILAQAIWCHIIVHVVMIKSMHGRRKN